MIKISPSILSADFANLERDIHRISDADYVHVDVMDGVFVPNISIGIPVLKSIRKVTDMFLDVHLMITKPVRYVEEFCDAGADLVVGHHSHRINPIEYYNGKYICYSLGNFSFAGNNKPDDMSSYIFQLRVRVRDGVASSEEFKIIPCRISSRTDYNDFTPTPYTKDTHIEAVLRVLKENGKKLEYAVESYPLKFSDEE